ncbi:Uncharacterised protein g5837 [Pycnogonum litorale]
MAEYGLPSEIIAENGTQYISTEFQDMCMQNEIKLTLGSPKNHHQANSATERFVGTCKNRLKKAKESGQSPSQAIWMHRVTPIDNETPSPYELLFGRKPQTTIPSVRRLLKSSHIDNDAHIERNEYRQKQQAIYYNMKASLRSTDSAEHGKSLR